MHKSLLILALLFSFFSCRESQDKPISKQENKFNLGELKKRMVGTAFIDLPQCFNSMAYNDFSVTNEHNFNCYEKYVYFSLDEYSYDEVDDYKYYYSNNASDTLLSDLEFMLDYTARKRLSSLKQAEISPTSKDKTNRKETLYTKTVNGAENNYDNEITYTFAGVKLGGKYYILQGIADKEAMEFYYPNFLAIFKSIRKV